MNTNDGGPAVGGDLDKLAAKWRERAKEISPIVLKVGSDAAQRAVVGVVNVLLECADDLEATLQSLTSRQSAVAVARVQFDDDDIDIEWLRPCESGYLFTHPEKSEAGAVVDDAMVDLAREALGWLDSYKIGTDLANRLRTELEKRA